MPNQPTGAASARPFQPATRVRGFGTTVFAEFTALANEHQAVNLGQGFPNFGAPDFIKAAAQQAVAQELNQYARSQGHPRLVNALAHLYGPLLGRSLDPMTEIVVTAGATEAIFATVQALVEPGDEVILIEPFYDSYPAAVTMAGGKPVFVPLRPSGDGRAAADWVLDMDELAAAFSPHTRLIILNTPHNPFGKLFTRDELTRIAALVQAHDAYVLADEVYEWIVYGQTEHVRMATLPGMWERTITLGSAGKTFSVTGWKIGWAIAPASLARAVFQAHQWMLFAVATPFQEAVAAAFEAARTNGYFAWLSDMYRAKRDKLYDVLAQVGLNPVRPEGSYFIIFDTSGLDVPIEAGRSRDDSVCRWFTRRVGVTAIPPSPFYSSQHQRLTDNLARFCFCKTDEMLDEAADRLRARLG